MGEFFSSKFASFSLFQLFTLTLVLHLWHGDVCAQTIVVFADLYHQGAHAILNTSKCDNVPINLRGQVTAVNTQNHCARLYDQLNCQGNHMEVMARSPSHADLAERNFNDRTMSAGPCPDPCSVEVIGPPPPKQGFNVSIFDRSQFKGVMEVINVNQGCTIFPRKFNYRVLTINTSAHEGTCFQVYNNVDCQYQTNLGHDTVELRPGTPFHDNIARWNIRQMKAISLCSYKCQKKPPPPPPQILPTDKNEVVLYDEVDFKGNTLRLHLDHAKCLNLDQYYSWEGAAQSLALYGNDTGNSSCVTLFSTENCSKDYPTLRLTASVTNLVLQNFSAVTRSLVGCVITSDNKNHLAVLGAQRQKSKSSTSRWITALAVVVGLVVGALLLLTAVGKWWYPNMQMRDMCQFFKRNELGPGHWGPMRL